MSSYVYNCYNSTPNILGNSKIGNCIGYSDSTTGSYNAGIDGKTAVGYSNGNTYSNYKTYTQEKMKTLNSGLLTLLKNGDGAGKWEQNSSINGGYPYLVNNETLGDSQ